MRFKSGVFAGLVLCAGFAPAMAYEKFIPTGAGYSTTVKTLPSVNSDAQSLTTQTDIYESEIYRQQLEDQKSYSHLRRFLQNSDSSNTDFSVDY